MGNCKSVDVQQMGSGSTKFSKPKLILAIVGLDNAGKTVTTKVLQGTDTQDVTPTIGFTSTSFAFNRRDITLYDLGGGANIRGIWCQYYAEAYGFVFVIDASDASRLDECEQVLVKFLEHEHVRGKPILLLANKQDVPGALDEIGICDQLNLEQLANQFKSPCHVEMCSALKTQGKKLDPSIEVGLHWLIKLIDDNWTDLSVRVEKDVTHKLAVEKQEKIERAKRVQHSRELREQEEQMRRKLQGDNEDDDDHDELDSTNPFQPISKRVDEAQKREAANKKNKALKHRQDSRPEINTRTRWQNSDEEPDSMNHNNSHRLTHSINQNSLSSEKHMESRSGTVTQMENHPIERHPYKPMKTHDKDDGSDDRYRSHRSERRQLFDSHTVTDRGHDSPLPTVALRSAMSDDEECEDDGNGDSAAMGYHRLASSNRTELTYNGMDKHNSGPMYALAAGNSVSITGSNGLVPNGLLQPIENGRERKKKKRKFKLRNHRTAPSPDNSNGSPFPSATNLQEQIAQDTPRKQPVPLSAKRVPQLECLEENENDEDEVPSFTRKWNLVDGVLDMPAKPSGRLTGSSRPNTDYDDDLVT